MSLPKDHTIRSFKFFFILIPYRQYLVSTDCYDGIPSLTVMLLNHQIKFSSSSFRIFVLGIFQVVIKKLDHPVRFLSDIGTQYFQTYPLRLAISKYAISKYDYFKILHYGQYSIASPL